MGYAKIPVRRVSVKKQIKKYSYRRKDGKFIRVPAHKRTYRVNQVITTHDWIAMEEERKKKIKPMVDFDELGVIYKESDVIIFQNDEDGAWLVLDGKIDDPNTNLLGAWNTKKEAESHKKDILIGAV